MHRNGSGFGDNWRPGWMDPIVTAIQAQTAEITWQHMQDRLQAERIADSQRLMADLHRLQDNMLLRLEQQRQRGW